MTTLDATTDTLFEWTRTVDCSAFLDWNEEPTYSEHENAVVFKSLVATLKLNTALVSLVITAATMKMLYSLIASCSAKVHLTLVKADLIAQLINTLNLLSLSFSEAVDIHINIMKSIPRSLLLATPSGLENLEITDHDEQQAVYETQGMNVPGRR
ncbi:hypothetical protein BLNAU_23076 [Blattamonas nauphoetae]|uniref:Uncharacterized protein n=1 Tax=Blattamonas nauphoetae TaxID=2049346 RepID=A0ABQ9WUB7_9EUKA|nr:hypothetical protein BLNAU_23076 [Blattamonas nauphoetae]